MSGYRSACAAALGVDESEVTNRQIAQYRRDLMVQAYSGFDTPRFRDRLSEYADPESARLARLHFRDSFGTMYRDVLTSMQPFADKTAAVDSAPPMHEQLGLHEWQVNELRAPFVGFDPALSFGDVTGRVSCTVSTDQARALAAERMGYLLHTVDFSEMEHRIARMTELDFLGGQRGRAYEQLAAYSLAADFESGFLYGTPRLAAVRGLIECPRREDYTYTFNLPMEKPRTPDRNGKLPGNPMSASGGRQYLKKHQRGRR